MQDVNEIRAWRKQYRWECVARREAIAHDQVHDWNARITDLLTGGFPLEAGMTVGLCWPIRNEPDARFALRHWREQGVVGALPVVVEKSAPMQFREWHPGTQLEKGVHDIPFPVDSNVVIPDVAIAPANGFDDHGYRLGYGGGYFDRTLAAVSPRPVAIGLSFDAFRIESIYPQPYDIPMDFIVTESHVYRGGGNAIAALDPAQCVAEFRALLTERGLPRVARAAMLP